MRTSVNELYSFDSELLRKLAKQTNGTIKDLADKIGIAHASFIRYLNGSATPDLINLIKMSTYFQVPIDILMGLHTEEQYSEILKGNERFMLESNKRAYEDYLLKLRTTQYPDGSLASNDYISPYPYNLLDCLFGEPFTVMLDDDHLAGLRMALDSLTSRELTCILLYFEEGKTYDEIGKNFSITRERARQILAKALRKLRHPSRTSLIIHGAKGVEIRSLKDLERDIEERKQRITNEIAEVQILKEQLDSEMDIFKQVEIISNSKKQSTLTTTERLLSDKVVDLDLSIRSFNCLLRANCETVYDVLALMEDGKIFRIRNLGRKSIQEIQDRISSKYQMEFAPQYDKAGHLSNYKCTWAC